MKPFLVSLIVVEVSLGASLIFEGLRSRDSSMEDTLEVSKDAEAAGELYKQEAAKMPTAQESAKSILLANAETIGSIDEEIASEFSSGVAEEQSQCKECAREYSSACPKFWGKISLGMCIAPDDYAGPCHGAAYFSHMSVSDKRHYEKTCGVCWPCGSEGSAP